MVDGTGTTKDVGLKEDGTNGPKFTAPVDIATKKLIREPPVKRRPLIVKLSPALMVLGIELMKGPGVGVKVGIGVGVPVGAGVGVNVVVLAGVRDGVPLAVRVGVDV
jgi:hypothetical protein